MKNWVLYKLNDVCRIGDGNHSSNYPKSNEMVPEGVPFIRANNIVNGEVVWNEMKFITTQKHAILKKGHLKAYDILFTNRGEIGKIAIVGSDFENANLNSQIAWFRCLEKINFRFLFYFLSSPLMKNLYSIEKNGTALQQFTIRQINEIEIPLPPLPEQKRIVSIIDEAFEAIDKAIENTQKNLQNAKELFESYLNEVFDKGGEDWETKSLGDVGKPSMCKRVLKHQTSGIGDIPFYKIGTFGKTPDAYISEKLYNEFRTKYSFPKKGDILISASGTIGRTVRYDDEPAYFQDSNIVWIANDEKQVLNDYLFFFYRFCDWKPSKGATISRLYNSDLTSLKITFPKSLDLQRELICIINSLSTETQTLESKYQQKLRDLEELKKSILNKAFAGEL